MRIRVYIFTLRPARSSGFLPAPVDLLLACIARVRVTSSYIIHFISFSDHTYCPPSCVVATIPTKTRPNLRQMMAFCYNCPQLIATSTRRSSGPYYRLPVTATTAQGLQRNSPPITATTSQASKLGRQFSSLTEAYFLLIYYCDTSARATEAAATPSGESACTWCV